MIHSRIYGAEAVQKAMEQAHRIGQSGGPLQRAVGVAADHAAVYAISITHQDTGALMASHLIEQRGTRAVIYPSTMVINPKSQRSPAEYAPYEHARGGSHAFYARTVNERGAAIAEAVFAYLRRSLP